MFFFDPRYLVFVGPGLILSALAAWYVRSTFARWAQVPLSTGVSGAEAAAEVLRAAGVHDVRIEPAEGFLSDHYDPVTESAATVSRCVRRPLGQRRRRGRA